MAKQVLHRAFDLALLEVRAKQRIVVAQVPYNSEADIGGAFIEHFAPGAFARSARERGDRIPLLYGHASELPPIGRSQRLSDTSTGMVAELLIAKTDRGDEALALADDGALTGISPGFTVPQGGDQWTDGGTRRSILEAKLIELSLTPFPAYDDARVLAVRSVADALEALEALEHPPAPTGRGRSLLLAQRELHLLELTK